jgi:hypothetical protein
MASVIEPALPILFIKMNRNSMRPQPVICPVRHLAGGAPLR